MLDDMTDIADEDIFAAARRESTYLRSESTFTISDEEELSALIEEE